VFNLASAELKSGMHQESVATFTRALGLAPPEHVRMTMLHVGLAHYALGNPVEALKWYERGRALKDDTDVQQSIAIARLMAGELEAMFEFECKYHTPRRKPIADSGIPRWMGEDLTGKTIIVAHEQGYGDTIQFARFIPETEGRAGHLVRA
jgi:tetratricopeptide (TPR) repeat protein